MQKQAQVISLQKFRVYRSCKKLGAFFSKKEIEDISSDFYKFSRFTELIKFTKEEIEIINFFPTTKARLRDFVFYRFDNYSELENLAIYKNGLLLLNGFFKEEKSVFYKFSEDSKLTIADSLVVEVVVNGFLVWLSVAGRNLINLGVGICEALEFFRTF